jgi:hypothetical protein
MWALEHSIADLPVTCHFGICFSMFNVHTFWAFEILVDHLQHISTDLQNHPIRPRNHTYTRICHAHISSSPHADLIPREITVSYRRFGIRSKGGPLDFVVDSEYWKRMRGASHVYIRGVPKVVALTCALISSSSFQFHSHKDPPPPWTPSRAFAVPFGGSLARSVE